MRVTASAELSLTSSVCMIFRRECSLLHEMERRVILAQHSLFVLGHILFVINDCCGRTSNSLSLIDSRERERAMLLDMSATMIDTGMSNTKSSY